MESVNSLQSIVNGLLGGGLILVGPYLYSILESNDLLSHLPARYRRPMVALISGIIGSLLWLFAVWMGYMPTPANHTIWVQDLWQYGAISGFSLFAGSQVFHALMHKPGAVDAFTSAQVALVEQAAMNATISTSVSTSNSVITSSSSPSPTPIHQSPLS